MKPLTYSIVIATVGRTEEVARTLETIASQTRTPERIVIVDASGSSSLRQLAESFSPEIVYLKAHEPSAANQRNQGAAIVSTPLVAFIDDDMDVFPETCERICNVFEQDTAAQIGGVAARMQGASHPPPTGLLWLYYRFQAGYHHETYGARLFGPGINCFPCFELSHEELIPADWLNSACVFFRTQLFMEEKFPDFPGSSFMEDVHLSARIARNHALYFHGNASCVHRDGAKLATSTQHRQRAAMRIENQRKVATEVLGTAHFALKLWLHKAFITVSILRFQPSGKWESILGTWGA